MNVGVFIGKFRNQLFVLLLIAFAVNLNTMYNDYALDDAFVITQNKFVDKGIKGIPEILSTDLLAGFTSKSDLAVQPRYRPLPLISYAIEKQVFGANPKEAHLVNVLLFMLIIALVFKLMHSVILRNYDPRLSFIACLLFAVHPIHTEVIANIKGRDELLAFLFLLLSLFAFLTYLNNRKTWYLLGCMFAFFLALLCRESAIPFMALVPVILYFFCKKALKNALLLSWPYVVVLGIYLAIRLLVVGYQYHQVADVMNAPFLYATPVQAFATKIFILIRYFWVLVFPYALSSDYGYSHIPYIDTASSWFWISFTLVIALLAVTIYGFRRKWLLSFCILFYFIALSIGTNLILNFGSPMADRMLFQPSLAFCIVVAILMIWILKWRSSVAIPVICLVLILFSAKTISRNLEWKNTETLYLADVLTAPNSSRLTLGATEIFRNKAEHETNQEKRNQYLKMALMYGEKSLSINPDYPATYVSLGFIYYYNYQYDKTAELWLKGFELDSTSAIARRCVVVLSDIFYQHGNTLLEEGHPAEALAAYQKALSLNGANPGAWYQLGGCYFLKKDLNNAAKAWRILHMLDPDHRLVQEEFLHTRQLIADKK